MAWRDPDVHAIPPQLAEGLDKAAPGEVAAIEITPAGFGLHRPRLGADLYLPALMSGAFGSPPRIRPSSGFRSPRRF